MVLEETAIAVIQPSNNLAVNSALNSLEAQFRRAAEITAQDMDEDFTNAEREAVTVISELRLVNGLDLAAVLLRGKLIRDIEERALWTIHPERYTSAQEMAKAQAISFSEYTNIKDLTLIIFPWMEQHNMSIPEEWEKIGKSNFREMVPTLKYLITGETPVNTTVQRSLERLLEDVYITAHASGMEIEEPEAREQAVSNLLESGGQMTNRELRQTIRPERTQSVDFTLCDDGNGSKIVTAIVSPEQWTMLQNRLHGYMNPFEVTLPADPMARQREASNIAAFRAIANLITA